MKTIPLTKGYEAIVDDDFEWGSGLKWKFQRVRGPTRGYAYCYFNRQRILLHRVVMGVKDRSIHVDHINGFGLDCRRNNLRICSAAQNAHNSRPRKNRVFKGVYRNGDGWMARVMFNRKLHYLGTFNTPEEAAAAYNTAAKHLAGEFSRGNDWIETPRRRLLSRPMRKQGGGALGVKGVTRHRGKYRARLWDDGRLVTLGTFETIEEAAEAYTIAEADTIGVKRTFVAKSARACDDFVPCS